MPLRAISPSASENGIDIADSLLQDKKTRLDVEQEPQNFDLEALAGDGIHDPEDSGSDDASYIADSLAAANRKASNLKGKSVKKGGGFQAMGLNANLLKAITYKGFSVPTPIQCKIWYESFDSFAFKRASATDSQSGQRIWKRSRPEMRSTCGWGFIRRTVWIY